MKKKMMIFLLLGLIIGSIGCSDGNDVTINEDGFIIGVKNAERDNYQNVTYGEVFEDFFGDPQWSHFKTGIIEDVENVTQLNMEPAEEDEDGQYDVVEFEGKTIYNGEDTEVIIQFSFNESGDYFAVTYCSLDGIPQDIVTVTALVDKAFDSHTGNITEDIIEETTEVLKEEVSGEEVNLNETEFDTQWYEKYNYFVEKSEYGDNNNTLTVEAYDDGLFIYVNDDVFTMTDGYTGEETGHETYTYECTDGSLFSVQYGNGYAVCFEYAEDGSIGIYMPVDTN